MLGDHCERLAENGQAEELPAFVRPLSLPYLPEGAGVSIPLSESLPAQGDEAYRALVGHTYNCPACQRSPCPAALRLTRAWREVRR